MKLKILVFFLLSLVSISTDLTFNPFKERYNVPLRVPASEFGLDCDALFFSILETHSKSLVIEKNSLFDQYPELLNRVNNLQYPSIKFNQYYLAIKNEFNRPPTMRETIELIFEIRESVLKNYDELVLELSLKNDPKIVNLVRELKKSKIKLSNYKEIEAIEREVKSHFLEGKSNFTTIDEYVEADDHGIFRGDYLNFFKQLTNQHVFNGEHGELLAMGATGNNVIARGLHFDHTKVLNASVYNQDIFKRINDLEARLHQMSVEEIIEFIKPYRNGLLRHSQKYINENEIDNIVKSDLISKIIKMIKSKEMDLVVQEANDGTIYWYEVKAYKKMINKEKLLDNNKGKKSIYEQLLEHIALRDLLGLKEQVKFKLISPYSGIDQEAKIELTRIGVEY